MKNSIKVTQGDQKKRKSSSKCQTATDEMLYVMDFNQIISLEMAKTMQHLSNFVFISMVNFTLVSRVSYLDHLRSASKQDALNAPRTANLNLDKLFPDSILKKFRGRRSTL